ncbi:DUF4303 domain-containing protein [Paenibacillus sp. Leaf72]|uniref:DUF4303 domain-containing protein n=1 Tax=Paenibacillus sp. Leaf72 TaxID=1736234 RepID=UPI0006F20379|nr:DUF4303 domain-containing protein [Paenibacillus sp. Leaf72]KQO18336.1 hypothetical protein ASF12_06880 [Paenibacillus sp. Leaf72]
MNIYYSKLGRQMDGRTPIDRAGYYVLYEDGEAGYSLCKPEHVETITTEKFVHALVEGCKVAIQSFADSDHNKDVYAFNLYADEHNSIYIYMNTLESFEETLRSYPKLKSAHEVNSLKYNQGDFEFQYWQEHMGMHGLVIDFFEKLAYLTEDLEEEETPAKDSDPIVAFETGIMKAGFQVLVLKAVKRLIEEDAFQSLNKTKNFIAFAATGNDYLDYSLIMRKTIDPQLFYEIFPDLQEKDEQFKQTMQQNQQLSVGKYLDYWLDALESEFAEVSPFQFDKAEIDVFLQLESFGNALAVECIARLEKLADKEELEQEDNQLIYYYAEAIHFAGGLSPEQKLECIRIAERLDENQEETFGLIQDWATLLK